MAKRARFIVADACHTDLDDEVADAVISIDAVMFCQTAPLVAELTRLLKRGGRAVLIAAEAISQEAPESLSRDYKPVLTAYGFEVLEYRELEGYRGRLLQLYRGLDRYAGELRREIGVGADYLLAEAHKWLEREHLAPRVREVFVVARR